jgi:hypothetical protein
MAKTAFLKKVCKSKQLIQATRQAKIISELNNCLEIKTLMGQAKAESPAEKLFPVVGGES